MGKTVREGVLGGAERMTGCNTYTLERPSLRCCWGVKLEYRQDPGSLLVAVAGVEPDSPAAKQLKPGDLITNINDWEIGRLSEPEVAANMFRAAGNFVTLDIERENKSGSNWRPLDELLS